MASVESLGVDRRGDRREAKKARILVEAWALARRDGLAAISLRDLAERVDLRQPSLYAYFDSKLDLYDMMFADGNRQLLSWIGDLPQRDDPRRALAEFLRSLVMFSSVDVVRHQLLFQRTIPEFEPSPSSYAVAQEFYEIARQRLVAVGATEPQDIDLFSALANGLAHQQVANEPGGDRWARLAEPSVDMYLGHLRRSKQPSEQTGESK
jgi:AcrR family transcriptional regulator